MADQRIVYTEEVVGAGHPTKTDTLNRLALVEHNNDGTHKTRSFSVHKNGINQTAITNATWIKITWSAEEWDTNSNFASDRFTPTVAGKYALKAQVQWVGPGGAAAICTISIYKNGTPHRIATSLDNNLVINPSTDISCDVDANGTTDYFEVYVYHNFGSDRTITGPATDTFFQGHKAD